MERGKKGIERVELTQIDNYLQWQNQNKKKFSL